ncbi:MAG TPA: VCBS repeat-containing protein, partial [Terriglobales bacterium]|nr:VCBS repeat-containing protein [Terriglobales bacterium]
MPRNPARLAAAAFLLISVLAAEVWAQKPAPQNPQQARPQTPAAMGPTAAPPPRAAKTHARPGAGPPPKFVDVAQKLGLTASHISSSGKHYVIESMSGGIGLFDCDDDGRLDIIMANGSSVERYQKGGDPMVTLWRQQTDGTFKDITQQAGMTRKGWGMGVAV